MNRRTLAVSLVICLAAAPPIAGQHILGITFDPDAIENVLLVDDATELLVYLYLATDQASVAGYEAGIAFSHAGVVMDMEAVGPAGWTNQGSENNHVVWFSTPLPIPAGWLVIATLTITALPGVVFPPEFAILLLPAMPSSYDPPTPCFVTGEDPVTWIACDTAPGYVNPTTRASSTRLSAVKLLFR